MLLPNPTRAITLVFALLVAGCINIAISPGVSGSVIDKATRNPIPAATLNLRHSRLEDREKQTTADSHGRYAIGPLRVWTPVPFAPIRVSAVLRASAPGYADASCSVEGNGTLERIVELERR